MPTASEAHRCPHCHAIADVERHTALGFSCLVCGGPRLALDSAAVVPSAQTNALLENAGREQKKHIVFSAAGFLLAGMGALALIIAAGVVLTAAPGLVPSITIFLAASVPLVAGLFALTRAAAARALRRQAMRNAQVRVLGEAQATLGPLDAERAAQLLRIDPDRAQLLLAEASVASLLEEAPAPRLRVEAPSPTVLSTESELEHAIAADQTRARTVRGDTEI